MASRVNPSIAIEAMESRVLFSFSYHGELLGDAAKGGGGKGGGGKPAAAAPEIRLDLVALHEFGHSLGLDHSNDKSSIMYAYYNKDYVIDDFAGGQNKAPDSAINTLIQKLNNNTTGWLDSRDSSPGDGVLNLTYSFMRDGTTISGEGRKPDSNSLEQSLDAHFSGTGVNWRAVLVRELNRWAEVSGGKLHFDERADAGKPFNYSGAVQNDADSGDIRIGGHKFDGPSKVLAHAYFPPPNGSTAAGDAHFDIAENWVVSSTSSTTSSFVQQTSSYSNAFATGRLVTGNSLFTYDADDDHDWL